MAFYGILIVAVALFLLWFVRTNLFPAHLRGHGKDPGYGNTRVEGRFPRNGGSYDYGDKPRDHTG